MTLDPVPTGHARVVLPSAQAMYAAAARWRDEALIGDRSLFDGRQIDGRLAADSLVKHYIDHLDEGEGSFVDKLRVQLRDADADAVQVAAELIFVHSLISSIDAVKSRTKIKLIDEVLAIAQGTAGIPLDLQEALRGGVARPGQAYNNFRWKMLAYLVRVFEAVKALDPTARRDALATPGALAQVLSGVDEQTVWSQRYALEHLLFPDDCPAILSRDDRAVVVQTLGRPGDDVAAVVRRLEPNAFYGDRRGVNLYRTPYREQWQGMSPAMTTYDRWAAKVANATALDVRERDYKVEHVPVLREVFAVARRGEDQLVSLKKALIGFNLVDFRVTDDFIGWASEHPDDARRAFAELERDPGPESIDRFLAFVPVAKQLSGRGARLSLGSTFLMALEPEDFPPFREKPYRLTMRLTDGYYEQESATPGELYVLFLERLDLILAAAPAASLVLRDRLDAQGLAWAVATYATDTFDGWDDEQRRHFEEWRSGKPAPDPVPAPAIVKPDKPKSSTGPMTEPEETVRTVEDLAEHLYFAQVDVPWLQETIDLLADKRQLILQGPPGTGKTWIGRAVAEFVAGGRDRVETVQFHPAYSYEDFVAGLRPDPAAPSTFRVVDGPLVRLARRAANHLDETFVLLIDEINRGNIPAVFGELYYLLEYRNRPVTMTYDVTPFMLPPNLLLIGTMNTADRSITSLDAALRRRFFVRDLRPAEAPVQAMLRTYLAQEAPNLLWLADLLECANEVIGDPDQAIGPSHFMGKDVSERNARRAWDNAVIPQLRELFYSQPSRVEALSFDVLKAQVMGPDDVVQPD